MAKNVLSVLTAILGIMWIFALKQNHWLKDFIEPSLVIIGSFIALIVFLIHRWNNIESTWNGIVNKKENYDKSYMCFKKKLCEQYSNRLKSKLSFPLPINIGGKPTIYGTSQGYIEDYQLNSNVTIEYDNISSSISRILDNHNRLLLIGDAGAGKTTILLLSAIEILNNSDNQKLPLIINVGNWHTYKTFHLFYTKSIQDTYGLSNDFTELLVKNKSIVAFFDGFDEIKYNIDRVNFLKELQLYFGSDKSNRFIIASRKTSYELTDADAPVYAEYEVKPLDIYQVRLALGKNSMRYGSENALINAFDNNFFLQEVIVNPFYLNTASFLYNKGLTLDKKLNSIDKIKSVLVDSFVENQGLDTKDKKRLQFLSKNMEKRDLVVLRLADIDDTWINRKYVYNLLIAITCSLIGASLGYLVNGILGCILGGLIFGLIKKNEILILTLFLRFILFLITVFIISIINGLIDGVVGGIVVGIFFFTFDWKTSSFIVGFLLGLLIGSLVGVLVGGIAESTITFLISGAVTMAIFFLLVTAVLVGISLYPISENYNKYMLWWRFFRSMWPILVSSLILVTIFFLKKVFIYHWTLIDINILINSDIFWINAIAILLLSITISGILSGLIEHFFVRSLIWSEGNLPYDLVNFMDRMIDKNILEDNRLLSMKREDNELKQKTTLWRFRHKILQDYFANMISDSSLEDKPFSKK